MARMPVLEGDPRSGSQRPGSNSLALQASEEDAHWLNLSTSSWSVSRDWFDSSVRRKFEDAYSHFYNQHAAGSKYYHEEFAKRSKLFRPKTRTAIRNTEAAAALAAFGTKDIVQCDPIDQTSQEQRFAARAAKMMLQYRLQHSIPWYTVFVAGVQEAATTGTVISKNYWNFEEREFEYEDEYQDPRDGRIWTRDRKEMEVVVDSPAISILPAENLRLHPSCDWMDPIGTSMFLIEEIPMSVMEVKERMAKAINGPEFRTYDDGVLYAAIKNDWDSLRRARERDRVDRYEPTGNIREHDIIWVRQYIMRREGVDWIWFTLGDQVILSDPEPLEDVYEHGRDLYTMGTGIIEAHKIYPSGLAELIKPLQEESNENVNLRIENRRQAIMRRWIAARGKGVDLRALVRGVPGGVILADDINAVRPENPQDVTRSTYEDEDRLNMDMDDATGNFSTSTVSSNRKLSETVGGMEIGKDTAGVVQEFMLRTVFSTWVEKTLQTLLKMEAKYETNEDILRVVGNSLGTDPVTVFRSLKEDIKVTVNVGFGATSPTRRIERISMASNTVANLFPEKAAQMDFKQFAQDVFGAVGIEASRYYPHFLENEGEEDPRIAQMQQQIQELQTAIQTDLVGHQSKERIAMIKEQGSMAQTQARLDFEREKAQLEAAYRMFSADIEAQEVQIREAESNISAIAKLDDRDVKRKQLEQQTIALADARVEANRRYNLALLEMAEKHDQSVRDSELKSLGSPQGAKDLPGKSDKAGTISRQQFGRIPFEEG